MKRPLGRWGYKIVLCFVFCFACVLYFVLPAADRTGLRAELRKTFGFPESLRSSNVLENGRSSKLGSRFPKHLTLPFTHIIAQIYGKVERFGNLIDFL